MMRSPITPKLLPPPSTKCLEMVQKKSPKSVVFFFVDSQCHRSEAISRELSYHIPDGLTSRNLPHDCRPLFFYTDILADITRGCYHGKTSPSLFKLRLAPKKWQQKSSSPLRTVRSFFIDKVPDGAASTYVPPPHAGHSSPACTKVGPAPGLVWLIFDQNRPPKIALFTLSSLKVIGDC